MDDPIPGGGVVNHQFEQHITSLPYVTSIEIYWWETIGFRTPQKFEKICDTKKKNFVTPKKNTPHKKRCAKLKWS
jgi:hypothetical protein